MPHVIVKLWPGKTEVEKARLSDAILHDVMTLLGAGEESVSIGFEDVPAADWMEQVFAPDILASWEQLTKKPGYGPRPPNK